jgi:hypothetical protein
MLPPISSIATRRRQVVLFCRIHKAFDRFESSNVLNGSSFSRAAFSVISVPSSNPFIPCYRNISEIKRFVSHGDRPESKGRERGAQPLYFQRSPLAIPPTHHNRTTTKHPKPQQSLPITAYEFSGTASVLPANARHLSPCLGAALAVSPLAGNLMRLGQRQPHDFSAGPANDNRRDITTGNHAESGTNTNTDHRWSRLLSKIGFLANNLFFQLIRESPIHMVRNKSMPAVYLTPGMIGCLLAHHHHSTSSTLKKTKITRSNHQDGRSKGRGANRSKDDSNAIIKESLKRDFGIKSNHIYDNQWTGISLARWMDLVITNDHGSENNGDLVTEVCQQSLVSALWLIALWGINPSKESLSDYYEALERVGIVCYPDQQQQRGKYQTDAFTENDFDPTQLGAAMNRLLEHYGCLFRSPDEIGTIDGEKDDAATARAFELVCAAIVLQQQQTVVSLPPVVPNGYFAFEGGDTKADCAEVVVREILILLLWDENSGTMEISRLPVTTSLELKAFFHKLNELKGSKANTDEEAQKHEQEELGQAWFDLLSDLPHCDYLSENPNGRAFELAPTSESISKALWHLLVGDDEETIGGQPWTSLQDLANFWSEQKQQQQQPKALFVKHDRLKHQSDDGGSGSIFIEHELLSLHLQDNSRAIELRLRCDFQKASGMAAVTHLTKPRQKRLLDSRQVQELKEICFRRNHHHGKDEEKGGKAMARARFDPSLVMLCLALQSEYESPLLSLPEDGDDSSLAFESLLWLATPYGPDRRELMAIGGGDPSDHDHKILTRSRLLLKERILHACRFCEIYTRSGAHLLSWILQESPIVVETSSSLLSGKRQKADDSDRPDDFAIELALLSLPTSVLGNDSILEAIERNWACFRRGRVITRAIRWKHQKLSAWQVFVQSKLHELAEVSSLSRSIERRNDAPR